MSSADVERWRRVEAALTAALEVTTGQRTALLDGLCAGDDELRHEVDSLLAAHEKAGQFLASSAGAFAAPYVAELPDDSFTKDGAGSIVGRYRLVDEIGRGGMGTVWLAERADGHFEQRVALKLIKRGMDSEEILARFLRERQILARLAHPNIARLLDGGVSDDGRPYFVMEHVAGVPITRWCDEQRHSIEDRLRLFGTVCRAVQFAHRNLIVHRDLKPSNVLVAGNGEVKLLDFGVAKLLSEELSEEPALTAVSSSGPMTPEYASPEQLTGQPVTTASDVYQLGVLFYELLAGQRPYRFEGRDRREMERVVREVEPARPSSAVRTIARLTRRNGQTETIEPVDVSVRRGITPERLRRRLRGDLDAIALRALRKEPEQRQPSAEALADDVDRHLAYLPLVYGGGGWTYGAGKFLRRYRLRIAALALLVVASAGFGALYVSRIRAERDRARREVAKTTEITAVLRRVFRGWNPDAADRDKVSAEALLSDAVRRARIELASEPEVLAATLSLLGDMQSAVGQRATADTVLSQALVMQQASIASPNDLAATLGRRGWLLQEWGRFAEAESSLRAALAMYDAMPGEERQEAAEVRHGLALVLRQLHRYPEAESLYREILRKVPARHELLRSEIAGELAYTLFLQARYPEAVELLRPALALQLRHFGVMNRSTLYLMRELGSALRGPETLAEAEALAREAFAASRTLYGANHMETISIGIALAVLLERKGDFVAADSVARQTVPSTGRSYIQADLPALSLRTLGSITLVLGRRAESETVLRRALADLRGANGDEHPDKGDLLNRLAFILLSRGAPDADAVYAQAVAFDRAKPSAGPYFVTDGYEYLGWAARRKGDLVLAEALYRRALTLYEKELPVGHPYRAQTVTGLGQTLLDAGQRAEAERYLEAGLAQWRATRPPATQRLAETAELLRQVRAGR